MAKQFRAKRTYTLGIPPEIIVPVILLFTQVLSSLIVIQVIILFHIRNVIVRIIKWVQAGSLHVLRLPLVILLVLIWFAYMISSGIEGIMRKSETQSVDQPLEFGIVMNLFWSQHPISHSRGLVQLRVPRNFVVIDSLIDVSEMKSEVEPPLVDGVKNVPPAAISPVETAASKWKIKGKFGKNRNLRHSDSLQPPEIQQHGETPADQSSHRRFSFIKHWHESLRRSHRHTSAGNPSVPAANSSTAKTFDSDPQIGQVDVDGERDSFMNSLRLSGTSLDGKEVTPENSARSKHELRLVKQRKHSMVNGNSAKAFVKVAGGNSSESMVEVLSAVRGAAKFQNFGNQG
ncbi:hypothetical protein BABINDRAFT_167768 [Babjeviella inositovora NRRL Y-12698]|uniref:Uncharacterized protein n=1 Tax=Babjeviella inositovora NRRL Y-12698 TaxID=984486 RepID=A0A1E3QNI6_9ASCO|nr:uncharacterized protein BABINDRAFT_167768 [Babjeviella inositovora NRRL Y-12698]ODQ79245.1 hypothetical protein BABINDRAFT_167768 [Babjeviella inositovora NRRL Y-12698]